MVAIHNLFTNAFGRARQTGRSYLSPVTLLILLLNLLVFAEVFWLATQSTRRNIDFIDAELDGLRVHQAYMQQFVPTPTEALYEKMRQVGDSSNLILDPELGSYYLMNLVIRLIPDMLALSDEVGLSEKKLLTNRLLKQMKRSLDVSAAAGVELPSLRRLFATLKRQTHNKDTIYAFYTESAQLLAGRLNERRANEIGHLYSILLTVVALCIIASVLLVIAVSHYLKRKTYRAAQEKLLLLNQLKQANAELETFAYYTAHDLKEPIRTISCFASLVDDELKQGENAQNMPHLTIIRNAALRMEQLVKDVLSYLKENHEQEEASQQEAIELSQLIEAVKEDLQAAIQETAATIHCDVLPVINARAIMLRRVLQNVIQNALCYHRPDVAPIIHISASKGEAGWVIAVRDNGSGFDMRYCQDIVTPFTRLHDHHHQKGSGLGLAICHKIMQQLGGSIAFESEPQKGTTVFLSLPAS